MKTNLCMRDVGLSWLDHGNGHGEDRKYSRLLVNWQRHMFDALFTIKQEVQITADAFLGVYPSVGLFAFLFDCYHHMCSAIPIGLSLGHCPIRHFKCPIDCRKSGQNDRNKTNYGGQCPIVSESSWLPQHMWCDFLLSNRLKTSWSLRNYSQHFWR